MISGRLQSLESVVGSHGFQALTYALILLRQDWLHHLNFLRDYYGRTLKDKGSDGANTKSGLDRATLAHRTRFLLVRAATTASRDQVDYFDPPQHHRLDAAQATRTTPAAYGCLLEQRCSMGRQMDGGRASPTRFS